MEEQEVHVNAAVENGKLFAGLTMTGSPKKKLIVNDKSSLETANGPVVETRPTQNDTNRILEEALYNEVATPPSERVTSAPATDKLLSMLGEAKLSSDVTSSPKPDSENSEELIQKSRTRESLATDATADAFQVATEVEAKEVVQSTRNYLSVLSRVAVVSEDTPIPNSDVALRLLRKFAKKTRPHVPQAYGGLKVRSILGHLFGASSQENVASLTPYAELIGIILEETEPKSAAEETDIVVESIFGGTGDTMQRARLAMASFSHLLSVWCHASQRLDGKDPTSFDLLINAMDTTTALVAHGCLDGVAVILCDQSLPAIQLLEESIIVADLTRERSELAALKFLLTTGCRSAPDGDSLLKGQHLLQAIRVLYHSYLTTDSESNKTTARASLQQLVTNVFRRMLSTKKKDATEGFPSSNHRDAFLVLRSLCKLSMRNLPEGGHTGLSVSGSSVAWDGVVRESRSPSKQNGDVQSHEKFQLLSAHAIHPALESKILALELLLYVLQHTDMSGNFLQHSGPQFQYAIRNYLCVSLLKNCTSENTVVVNLSLRLFVPLIRNFRSHLKTEIEAFVTNVFFVILDSKHSTLEHKNLVVILFEEICSDPQTLAEIFLNYDCDLSAVDLFHRIVTTLSRVAKTGIHEEGVVSSISFVAGAGAVRMEKMRGESRELRLEAMRALRQILASLHASIVEPMKGGKTEGSIPDENGFVHTPKREAPREEEEEKTLVQIYDSKKKRRAEESEAILRFNQKPSAGIKYADKCGHIKGNDPVDVARYLLKNKDRLEKTQIGEFLGRESSYQDGFALKVLHEYANMLDFEGLLFDDAIKYYLSGFRLPGEAQKIDRIMEKFAERFTKQNPTIFPTADAAFILAFSIIMLNTDLHNPAIKEERRMTKEGFLRNNRGICDGKDLPEEMLTGIFDRIKKSPISLKEDDEAREKFGAGADSGTSIQAALSPAVFFNSHYEDLDKSREHNFQKERDQIVRTTESLLRRKRSTPKDGESSNKHPSKIKASSGKSRSIRFVRTEDTGLRDEYVAPMFEVTWGAALAAFSTAMESANGTVGALLSIATDEELEHAAENAAETIEVCLTGIRFAICTAGLCGNETARDAFMLALSRFTHLGSGSLLEPRHVRCIQTLLALGRDDGELLGNTWEHIFKLLSAIHRFHELFQQMARNDRAAAAAANRRRKRLEELEQRKLRKEERRRNEESSESVDEDDEIDVETDEGSTEEELFSDDEEFLFEDEMDLREIEEANARVVYDAVSEVLIEAIYQRSASLSGPCVKEFVFQLCRVSRMEISGYGGHAGSNANTVDLSHLHFRQQHTLVGSTAHGSQQPHYNQPNIYNLQKLVEVTHYNMDSRPRLVFSDIWTTVSAHLTSTALHSNAAVAMYAVDSFRQLSIQYLQREELGGFEFQKKFLKPFEIVMAKSEHVSVKELLLKCIERIIMMFGADESDNARDTCGLHLGTLRSGWRPILAVLGLAGRDDDDRVAKLGFKMLTGQLRQCLSVEKNESTSRPAAGILLAERFVDLVDSLMMFIGGPHEEMSLISIDHLVTLTSFLADDSFALPLSSRRTSSLVTSGANTENGGEDSRGELELWWPILLGISRAIGDVRKKVRLKSMISLFGIINEHFFPTGDMSTEDARAPKHGDFQTLQLLFRGVLTPVLEYADSDDHVGPSPPLPDDFERFATKPPIPLPLEERNLTWLETTFEHFLDGCIALCMRSIKVFNDDCLVEEIFAMLNSCTLSDSGGLGVRGLRRLQQFVTEDLDKSHVDDATWATVCHMLQRCLYVRGLPARRMPSAVEDNVAENSESMNHGDHNEDAIREFVAEENLMQDRRYIGSNVSMIIGSLLMNESYAKSMGQEWRLFLISGLGRGVKEWEEAGAILAVRCKDSGAPSPPNYIENAIYGRKLMNKLIMQLIVSTPSLDCHPPVRNLVRDQIDSLLTLFREKESALSRASKAPSWEASQLTRVTKLIYELVSSLITLEDSSLSQLMWLTPMLHSCMESKNETVRRNFLKLQHRMEKIMTETSKAESEVEKPLVYADLKNERT